jgi:glycosyltransferase involved in cell wall biosynthesis
MDNSGVSIIICCYNSDSRLKPTLQHLWNQQPLDDGSPIEIVLVDNCCTDSTVETAKKLLLETNCTTELRVVSEPVPGQTHARIAGIRAARYSTLVFCDDDNWLCTDYCRLGHQILSDHVDVALVGGCSEGVFEMPVPKWFGPISGAWALGGSDYQGYLDGPDPFLRGAGLVARRSLLVAMLDSGFEFILGGRSGTQLTSGDDFELSTSVAATGYRLYFDGRLKLCHWIPAARTKWKYAIRLWKGFGAGTVVGDPARIIAHPRQKIRNLIRTSIAYQFIRATLSLCRNYQPLLNEGSLKALSQASRIGRLSGLASLGVSYRRVILRKAKWLSESKSIGPRAQNITTETQ